MSVLLNLLQVRPGAEADSWLGAGHGPAGKRAYGGQFLGQGLLSAARTVPADGSVVPTSLHMQFLRAGDAGETTEYLVERSHDGRTAMTRRVLVRQRDRVLAIATASFTRPLDGPEHGDYGPLPEDPAVLDRTGPAGPAPGLPLDELDIRIVDEGSGPDFRRRFWWRATVPVPADPIRHAALAVYVTDVYFPDPALRVHGFATRDRTHRSGTTDAAIWFHRDIRADRWNLLESRSPAAGRGRGLVTAGLIAGEGPEAGRTAATFVHEGVIATRETSN